MKISRPIDWRKHPSCLNGSHHLSKETNRIRLAFRYVPNDKQLVYGASASTEPEPLYLLVRNRSEICLDCLMDAAPTNHTILKVPVDQWLLAGDVPTTRVGLSVVQRCNICHSKLVHLPEVGRDYYAISVVVGRWSPKTQNIDHSYTEHYNQALGQIFGFLDIASICGSCWVGVRIIQWRKGLQILAKAYQTVWERSVQRNAIPRGHEKEPFFLPFLESRQAVQDMTNKVVDKAHEIYPEWFVFQS